MNATDTIFGLAYQRPCVDLEVEEIQEWPVEMYLLLRDVLRDQALVRMGLDPREYSFETDDVPWGSYGDDAGDEWEIVVEEIKPLRGRRAQNST